jgi:hypothetical protein
MADTAVAITAGTGTNIDTRTEGTNGNHRQVIVIGDPATNAGVAPVDATNGLSVAVTTVGGVVPNSNGRAAAASSAPVVLSNEDAEPRTSGGLSAIYFLDVDETPTSQEIKATAGQLYKIRITNFATSARYVRLYNAAAASVTVGTTTPLDVFILPAGSSTAPTVITEAFGGLGLTFGTGLTVAATTGFADNDTGAPGANEVMVSAYYK